MGVKTWTFKSWVVVAHNASWDIQEFSLMRLVRRLAYTGTGSSDTCLLCFPQHIALLRSTFFPFGPGTVCWEKVDGLFTNAHHIYWEICKPGKMQVSETVVWRSQDNQILMNKMLEIARSKGKQTEMVVLPPPLGLEMFDCIAAEDDVLEGKRLLLSQGFHSTPNSSSSASKPPGIKRRHQMCHKRWD